MKKHTAAFLLTGLSLACMQAWADTPEADKAAAKSEESAAFEEKVLPLKYPVEIKVDSSDVKKMLKEHLPLITQQQQEELDREQMGFLIEDVPEQVNTMLRTKGYFNSRIDVRQKGEGYLVDVSLGPQTKVDNVGVAIVGDILQDGDLGRYYKEALDNWQLPVGDAFSQSDWSSSKTSVLTAVTRKKYPLAKLVQTQATINPNTQTADLNVVVESNRPIYFGDFHISGIQRYPESVVRGMAQFAPGSPYDLDKLLDYQQALEQDGHYSGASVQADFDNLSGDRVPVKVTVSEVKRQKLEAGLRFDSEYGIGGRVGYDHYNLFGRGYIGSLVVDADKYETTVAAGVSQPRNSNGHYLTSNISYNRSTTQKLEKQALNGGIWRVRDRNDIESRIGIEYITEKRRIPDTDYDLGRSHATMLTASWRRQAIETALRPENGYYLDIKGGATLGKLLSSTTIARARANAGYYFTPENKKIGTFIARGRLGYVYARENDEVPSSLQFRTGGATSIRGYELDSIGLAGQGGAVLPDRALAVASLEYQYPVTKSFSAAVFHDMGDVASNFKRMKIKHGSGLGVRWFSPVAPFSFDIAYGHSDKKLRWHISLGTRF
ncbi:outer membrane protein, OMP85 family [Neisseria weaveri]|uniref:Translocation and assembly module subunit TamA n=2 Tax=Neisseria weaveri TaxID=28091 RepID=A0A3S5B4N0_9NEIS|nr:autotransporter assembly complex family protein [Neisseria weaveri]VEJ51093.1 outer membrane protein, OMP85 family [Neisseria weaveri]